MTVSLGSADLLMLKGADAASFAHTQFTSDVKSLADHTWQWSAWLDPQGRTRHFFLLMRTGPTQLIAWLPLGGAAAMRDGLARFVFRSAVKIETPTGWTLHSVTTTDVASAVGAKQVVAHHDGYCIVLPGPSQRLAWIAPAEEAQTATAELERWRLDDIAAGLPLLAPELGGEFVPQALDLERLDAIRFDKGCYPGQEIVARLHFRGGNKRHLQRLRVHGKPPAIGASVLGSEGQPVGQVLYAAADSATSSMALAVLAQTVSHEPLSAADSRAEIIIEHK
ncbi:MAG: folate-binding protein [Dokdonella sp.]